MKLSDLVAECRGKNDVTIKALIESTDEYQATLRGGIVRDQRNMFNAGILLARGERADPREAMVQAAEQGMVADAAYGMMLSDKNLTWVPSGPTNELHYDKNDSFVRFLDGESLNLDDPTTRLNCWEAIVVAAINGGVLENGTSLIRLYRESHEMFSRTLTRALIAGAQRAYQPSRLLGTPVCGDIVLFDGLAHVAIATGYRDDAGCQVLSFWPAPAITAAEFGHDGTLTPMVLTTIEALSEWMLRNMARVPTVTFGSPSWQELNQL